MGKAGSEQVSSLPCIQSPWYSSQWSSPGKRLGETQGLERVDVTMVTAGYKCDVISF